MRQVGAHHSRPERGRLCPLRYARAGGRAPTAAPLLLPLVVAAAIAGAAAEVLAPTRAHPRPAKTTAGRGLGERQRRHLEPPQNLLQQQLLQGHLRLHLRQAVGNSSHRASEVPSRELDPSIGVSDCYYWGNPLIALGYRYV